MKLEFDRVKVNLTVRQSVPSETVRVHVEAVVAATPEQASAAPETSQARRARRRGVSRISAGTRPQSTISAKRIQVPKGCQS